MPEAPANEEDGAPEPAALVARMLGLVVVGAPLVYVLWEALNSLLSGHPGEIRYGLVVPALVLFTVFVVFVARLVRRWDESRENAR